MSGAPIDFELGFSEFLSDLEKLSEDSSWAQRTDTVTSSVSCQPVRGQTVQIGVGIFVHGLATASLRPIL